MAGVDDIKGMPQACRNDDTPALSADVIDKLLAGTQDDLANYITKGVDACREGAIDSALEDAYALALACTLVEDGYDKAAGHDTFPRLAWMASSCIERALFLRQLGREGES